MDDISVQPGPSLSCQAASSQPAWPERRRGLALMQDSVSLLSISFHFRLWKGMCATGAEASSRPSLSLCHSPSHPNHPSIISSFIILKHHLIHLSPSLSLPLLSKSSFIIFILHHHLVYLSLSISLPHPNHPSIHPLFHNPYIHPYINIFSSMYPSIQPSISIHLYLSFHPSTTKI